MSELLSLVLTLRPNPAGDEAPEVNLWWGRAAQQAFLAAVHREDPDLAEHLHSGEPPRPYTVSSLLGHFPQRRLDPNATYTLRFTALNGGLAERLQDMTRPSGPLAPGQTLELDRHPFEILAATADAGEHPWAGRNDYADLTRRLTQDAPARSLAFHLASPLTFHSRGRNLPLPLPDLFFTSLLQRWNAFAPIAFPQETRRYAAEVLAISRFDLESRAVHIKDGGLRVGAVGRVRFTALNRDRYWLGILHTLAAFAFYAGVGLGTTQGMGQCKSLE
ncbi:MAG: CRISPR system precrRNA processing endoribonuclease RAMP protein Cas6 [Anaerolineae bacterium]|nr:MAG: CRISPR system precrRNA processing endoribonuclease RAMP protein Cas6 [Anaerolineae bacterium]